MSILHNILFFMIAIGVLVTFHEFGHYWVARKVGVKVLRFSIGFGKPLFRWTRDVDGDDIEYVIAAIPLGGYVKMLDEREGEVTEQDRKRAFNNQSISRRIAIVSAGPIFNFILAIFLYWAVFVSGTIAERALLGISQENSVAEQSGFSGRDEVLRVGETEINSWNQLRIAIISEGLDGGDISVIVNDIDGIERERVLELGDSKLLKNEGDVVEKLGFRLWFPDIKLEPIIGGVLEEAAAERSGLTDGDLITGINGERIESWGQVVDRVRSNPDKLMIFQIERDGFSRSIKVTPESRSKDGSKTGYIGAYQYVPEEVRDKLREELLINIQYGMFEAMPLAVVKTWDMSLLTLRVLWKMLTGEASLSNISGPITIARYAGITAKIGLNTFLGFLAIISVSLGVLNLLPIPLLDGGHLFYYLIEIIKGSPVSEAFEIIGQKIGIMILGFLMFIALFNDFQRLMQ